MSSADFLSVADRLPSQTSYKGEVMVESVLKRCSRCEEWKSRTEFHQSARSKDGLQRRCKVCHNWDSHLQWLRTREKLCAQKRAWNARNTERARPNSKAGAPVVGNSPKKALEDYIESEWVFLCARYDNRCVWCDSQAPLIADYVIPLSRGGKANLENIQPLCARCHKEKKERIMDFRFFHDSFASVDYSSQNIKE